MDLWRRSALLKFGVKGKEETVIDTEKIYREGGAIPKITFDIVSSIIDKNKATIAVYNLEESTRNLIDDADKVEDIYVELYTGYSGDNVLQFKGDAKQAENMWDGQDYVTSFKSYDGLKASKKKHSKSYAPKTDYVEMIKDTLKGLGDTISGVVTDVKKEVSQNGITLVGATDVVMNKLLGALPGQNLEYTIQNGVAYVKPAGSMINPNDIPVISANTGMIGSPTKTKDGVEFEVLLQQGLVPSSGVELLTDFTKYNGIFILQKVHKKGDTRGDSWSAACTAVKDTEIKKV